MNSLNSLLNIWDFEEEIYTKEFDFEDEELKNLSNKYKNSIVEIHWNHILKSFHPNSSSWIIYLYPEDASNLPIQLSVKSKINLSLFSKKLKYKIVIDLNRSARQARPPAIAGRATHTEQTEKQIIQSQIFHEFFKEFLLYGTDSSGPLKYLISDEKGRRVFRMDANKTQPPKLNKVLKSIFPHIYEHFNQQKLYPIMDLFFESRFKKNNLINKFEIIRKEDK